MINQINLPILKLLPPKPNNQRFEVQVLNGNWGMQLVTGIFPSRKIPLGRFHPGTFHCPPTKPSFAKYTVDANLFPLVSSILTRAKRAINRNNAATEKRS